MVEDSAHVAATTAAALAGFARFVPPGGFFVVEDGCVDVDGCARQARLAARRAARAGGMADSPAGADFAVRRDLELYGITCHPHGFLQRRGGEAEPARPALPAAIVREQVDGPG